MLNMDYVVTILVCDERSFHSQQINTSQAYYNSCAFLKEFCSSWLTSWMEKQKSPFTVEGQFQFIGYYDTTKTKQYYNPFLSIISNQNDFITNSPSIMYKKKYVGGQYSKFQCHYQTKS